MGREAESSLILPERPVYPGPFSYEIHSPEIVRDRLLRISEALLDPREDAIIRLGPETNGVVEPPWLFIRNVGKYDPNLSRTTLFVPISLPLKMLVPGFIDESNRSRFNAQGRRILGLEKDLKQYLDPDLQVFYTGEEHTPYIPSKGIQMTTGSLRYELDKDSFKPNYAPLFNSQLEQALTTVFIYLDHLLKYRKASFSPVRVVIDPEELTLVQRFPPHQQTWSSEEKSSYIARSFIPGAPINPEDLFPFDQFLDNLRDFGISVDEAGKITFIDEEDEGKIDLPNNVIELFPRDAS